MNQFNALHGDEPTDPPREWKIQPTADHFKATTYPPKINPVVSAIMGILKYHSINNGDVEVHPSEFPFESNSVYVTYTDTNTIK